MGNDRNLNHDILNRASDLSSSRCLAALLIMQPNAFLSFLCGFRLEKKKKKVASCPYAEKRNTAVLHSCKTNYWQKKKNKKSREHEGAEDVTSPLVVDPFRLEAVLLLRLRSL